MKPSSANRLTRYAGPGPGARAAPARGIPGPSARAACGPAGPRLAAVLAGLAIIILGATAGGIMSNDVQATNPDRFLMGVERIGVRCFATSDVEAVDPLRVERHLCEAAAAVIRERERGGGDRPVIALEVVDGRMHEPDVLTVLVQGHLQDAGRVVPGATGGEGGGGLLVVSLGLFRNITDPIAGNLFPAAPHAVFYPEPEAERTWRGEPGEDLRAALGRMIDAALAYGYQPSPNRG